MKSIKVLFLSAIFSCAFLIANAADINPTEAAQDLQKQVSELVLNSDVWSAADVGTTLKVKFMVLDNDEIIVISTDNEQFDSVMKSVLNYETVKVDEQVKNKVFILPIRLSN